MNTKGLFLTGWLLLLSSLLFGEVTIHKSHGLSRFHDLKYPASFKHFDYVNPQAPKGGIVSLFAHGTFDSLNPYAPQGNTLSGLPSFAYMRYGFTELNEPLMVGSGQYAPSGDEPRSAYGLIAESVEYPDDNQWIIFNLRPEARFHDGHEITSEDVIFSFKALSEKGSPRYKMQLDSIASVEALGQRKVRFNFKQPGSRQQLFHAAELPILPAHFWKNRAIDKSTLVPPLNSGPYRVSHVEPGKLIVFSRVKDYWGRDLPVNKGKYNFDTVIIHFYRDFQMAMEAFKSGGHDLHLEVVAKNWQYAYDFPAVIDGRIKKRTIPHQMAYGSSFFFFNTRRPLFRDVRVRQAITLMFDYEWTNRVIFHNAYRRSHSYFPNSSLGAIDKPTLAEQKLLSSLTPSLPNPIVTQAFLLPITSGDGQLRKQKRQSLSLLNEAGWTLKNNQLINNITQQPFVFEFIETTHATDRYLLPFKKNLESIGITMKYTVMDSSQYYARMRSRDFDMIAQLLPQTLSPGLELIDYFHSSRANDNSSRNFAGIDHPVVDQLLQKLTEVNSQQELQTLIRSLDRVLLWNYYGIPKWHSTYMRVAHWDKFGWPEQLPEYTTSFSTWWQKP
ncbi:extracellular solute-binding protein [Endozoicomonas sp. 8E]|uniref:extracellular solute-binding protein n=1 Tax=Endozoicomonas sp. 8E TaxID=3035692 RepID=UPI0029390DB4|nr:extracellular solute-binding protein [Endozoicomonas sp. 8E]WOG28062.1 extracellular solute-binding protein [Endozoicomonas sp. 8E]